MSSESEQLLTKLRQHHFKLRTVESCTGGGIAAAVAAIPGASDVLDRAWVTYSNPAKHEEVGVSNVLLATHGAVSSEVVIAMAEGGLADQTICVAVSGIAGPGGGSADKPVGTVWMAVAISEKDTISQCFQFSGERGSIQQQAVEQAIKMMIQRFDDLFQ
ncbi:MAG: CinA family protein [Mariprofundaceae bacterium]